MNYKFVIICLTKFVPDYASSTCDGDYLMTFCFIPFLFAIFIDDLVKLIDTADIGCKTGGSCTIVYFYMQMILSCWRHQLRLYSL